jgi:hypothetical protein
VVEPGGPACVDKQAGCKDWAASGECDRNPGEFVCEGEGGGVRRQCGAWGPGGVGEGGGWRALLLLLLLGARTPGPAWRR